jgi:hypothetical protein
MSTKFRTTIAPVAVVLATAAFATSATAEPIDSPAHRRHTDSTITVPQDLRSPDARDAAAGRGTFNAPEVTVLKIPAPAHSSHGGVDWADAAIGAGGATGLFAISLAGAMTLRRRQAAPRTGAALS